MAMLMAASSFAACPSIGWSDLQRRFAGRDIHLVFFASWCANCQSHLASYPKNTIFIATFDKRERAELVIKQFGITVPCFTDTDIARELNVRAVPAERDVRMPGGKIQGALESVNFSLSPIQNSYSESSFATAPVPK